MDLLNPMTCMKLTLTAALVATVALSCNLFADIVETKSGARLVGKVTKIADGTVSLSTAYAGEIGIKQSEITAITTDEAVAVRLASGTRIDGKISMDGAEVKVASKDGTVATGVEKISASWTAGGEDPQVVAMRRKWTFQTAADISGKEGNSQNSSIGLSFVAALASAQDALKFYGGYQYATTTNAAGFKTKSEDQTKGGVDYSSFFDPVWGWYVRSEIGRDTVSGIDLRSTSDFGGTYRFIKNPIQSLVGRLGAGYRFESYPTGPNNKGAVLSTGLKHSYEFNKYATIVTEVQYLPAFNDFADYRFVHDSALEVPIAANFWKLRVGLSNQYTSRPQIGRESMDTTYYTRLILNWK